MAGHAYTLLTAKETSDGHKLVCLRNPWGNFEWQGDWSDHSDLWTPAIMAEVSERESGFSGMSRQHWTVTQPQPLHRPGWRGTR